MGLHRKHKESDDQHCLKNASTLYLIFTRLVLSTQEAGLRDNQ